MYLSKIIQRGYYQQLPAGARMLAEYELAKARNKPGPGDGYIYEWTEEEPPNDYVGPIPYVSALRRVRRYKSEWQ